MQSNINLDPTKLSSSPIRQLYDVLSTFERNRDWSKLAQENLLQKVAARAQQSSPSYQTSQDVYYPLLSPPTPLSDTSNTLEDIERMLGIPVDDPDLSTPLPNDQLPMEGIEPSQLCWLPDRLETKASPIVPFPLPTTVQAPASIIEKDCQLSPQFASLMTPREIAAFNMLQAFQEISESRIESWGRIARLMVLQPMDGFAAVEPRPDV